MMFHSDLGSPVASPCETRQASSFRSHQLLRRGRARCGARLRLVGKGGGTEFPEREVRGDG